MSLEIDKIASQVEDLAREISQEREEQSKALKLAWGTFLKLGPQQEEVKKKLESSRMTFLVAEPLENLTTFPVCKSAPSVYSAMAVDGSHLSSERYSPLPYFLINLGVSVLSYGAEPDARLFSTPRLYFKQEDIAIRDPAGKEREMPVRGALLGVKRQVEEVAYLAALVGDLETDKGPVLALLDGSLVLWGLEDQKFGAFVHHAMLDEGLLKALRNMKAVSRVEANSEQQTVDGRLSNSAQRQEAYSGRQIAIASYISAPGSNEVVNLLRLYLCPHEPVNCDRFCQGKTPGSRECDALSGIGDNALFSALLKPGQRSPLFGCRSSIMKYYGEHRVCFFYVRLEEEVARVEVPQWLTGTEDTIQQTANGKQQTADSKQQTASSMRQTAGSKQETGDMISLAHSLIYDQCLRGLGYPAVLSEAHERAVLRAEDRKLFNSVLEQTCLEKDLLLTPNAKDSSKRNRWI